MGDRKDKRVQDSLKDSGKEDIFGFVGAEMSKAMALK